MLEGLKEPENLFQSVKFRMSNLSALLKLKKPGEKVMTILFIWLEQFISEPSDKVAQMLLKFSANFSVVLLTGDTELNARKKIVGSDNEQMCF